MISGTGTGLVRLCPGVWWSKVRRLSTREGAECRDLMLGLGTLPSLPYSRRRCRLGKRDDRGMGEWISGTVVSGAEGRLVKVIRYLTYLPI